MSPALPACVFTYGGDALLLPWCVAGVTAAGLRPVAIEDHADPLPPSTRLWLARHGVPLWTSFFPRRGNLNGTDCAAGICRALAMAADHAGTEHAVKLDADTLIVRPDFLRAKPEAVMLGLTAPGFRGGAFGCCYRLEATTALAAAAVLDAVPRVADWPEDLAVWETAGEFGPRVGLDFDARGGPFSAFPEDGDPADFLDRFSVLSVGNSPRGCRPALMRRLVQTHLRGRPA